MLRLILLAIALGASLPVQPTTGTAPVARQSQLGETYEIKRVRESSQQSGGESSGSSYDRDTIVERVIAVRPDGLELEYDYPKAATADERAADWQFPARVFTPRRGSPTLLGRPEVERRIDAWLKAAKLPRTACGQWYFTWNAFLIDCDPQSVIKTVEAFDLRSADVREGAAYVETDARAPGTLTRKASSPDGANFTAEMEVDPDAVRRARAESDVVAGEILRKPVTLDAALLARSKEDVSGTISVSLETDSAGNVRRRTTVTKLMTKSPNGPPETEIVTETLERRLVSGSSGAEPAAH